MPRQKIIVVDDFYDDPDEVRNLALSQEFRRKDGAMYPGEEAFIEMPRWGEVWTELRRYIPDNVDAPCPKNPPFQQGKFRLAMAADEETRIDRVHVDSQLWSAIVYLTPNEHCHGGLALYRTAETKTLSLDPAWVLKRFPQISVLSKLERTDLMQQIFSDPEHFEQIGLVPMAYNRAILLMAHDLHGTGVAFADTPETGRLTQHFEFYA